MVHAAPPRFPLFEPPSPLHRIERFGDRLGGRVEVWIKREDLLPLAFGGNKLRNLEYLVAAALADGADSLVTAGRRWSNHCRLTAAAGARAGLDVHLVLSGPPLEPPGPNQLLDELLGATVHVAGTSDRADRETLVERVAADLRAAGGRPYVIGVGGGGIGAFGQVVAAREVADQLSAASVDPAAVIVPSATGGTQAGLTVGLGERLPGCRVVGVAVAHPVDELRPAVEATVAALDGLLGSATSPAALSFDAAQLGDGYGRPTDAASEAQRLLARSEGILVDPIYTAKALASLVSAVRAGAFDGRSIVFWHAGGTPGLFEPLDAA